MVGEQHNATGRGSDQFPLRLPDGMRDQIKAQANRNGRSINAEIVARLAASLADLDMATVVKAAVKEALEEHHAS